MQSREMYELMWQSSQSGRGLDYALYVYGDVIADREEYKELTGFEAIQFYLMTKYGWLPSQVKSMSLEDLRFCMAEEMHGFVLPKECRFK